MDLQSIVDDIYQELSTHIGKGRSVTYIPELEKVNIHQFGIAVATPEGSVFKAGDASIKFSTQSIAKVFLLTIVLKRVGEKLWKRVGREPSGSSFNSIVQLENEEGIPRNPFMNSGAIVVTDEILVNKTPAEAIDDFLSFVHNITLDKSVYIDHIVAASEFSTTYRNFALANFMCSYGNIIHKVEDVLDVYCHLCALTMNCIQLAKAGLYLVVQGYNPITGKRVISPEQARRINAIMFTCGHYNNSGDFAYRVGLPGKSGVGGGILAIAPKKASIAVWSPGLNEVGNSLVGEMALELLTHKTGWSVFEP
ncbi:Glutaminase [Liberibacter crescens BT-1]|uniref:Glutaminase n=1 Tax=Liberibacter crescens (strain BT-1) TaxID=1215343 RepID=L0ESP8_LIBCB|nr:glutaminase [Liberibacter crescens]AGA64519.1 Glutaminase [Liberibacter crescens BT-1]AMC12672.1 glutaminase [Liberibacter crescens]